MKNGVLVVNEFLKGEKYEALYSHLSAVAAALEIGLKVRTNSELSCADPEPEPDFVLFWDKDVLLAKKLEGLGIPVFNSAKSIELCDDKAKTYLSLLGKVPQPRTLIAPLTYGIKKPLGFVKEASGLLSFPLVFKECRGSFGEQVFLCHTEEEVISHISGRPFILQEFVAESAGRDKRLEVVGGEVVAAMRRVNENDFRSNITGGGTAEKYIPTDYERKLAVKACDTLELSFGGVDILDSGTVCEVNSNAHIINLMNITGIDAAPLIFKEILKKI